MTSPNSSYDPTVHMAPVSQEMDSDGALLLTAANSPRMVEMDTLQIDMSELDEEDGEAEGEDSMDRSFDAAWTAAGPPSFHAKLIAGTMASWGSERDQLLRSRLCAVSLAMSLMLLIAMFFKYLIVGNASNLFFQTDHPSTMSAIFVNLRMLICFVATGLLFSPIPLATARLRQVQYLVFGGFVVCTMASQYFTNAQCIAFGETLKLAVNQKNSVILLTMLLMMYSALIPDSPRIMTRVIMLVTLWPTLSFAFVMSHVHPLIDNKDWSILRQTVAGNTIYTLFVSGLAIYIAFVLNRLRHELHDARQLGQYKLGEKLGEGGMGEVYIAEHKLLKRPCALKTIRAEVGSDPLSLARFEREVQTTAMLSHPNTIRIYDYGRTEEGTFYYVMEYLSGMSAADLVKDFGPLPPGRAVYLLKQACQALTEAHQSGLIHRDLKPANIYIAVLGGECDVVKVLDYGLVKVTTDPNAPQLSAEYTVSGTPAYMSPEQATASTEIDFRADLYALGGILYTFLTGRTPFSGSNAVQLMIAHAKEQVVPPSQIQPGVPADLEAVVLRCLAKNPDDRYADARELAAALSACACAADWDAEKARDWWLEQMEKYQPQSV